MLSSTTVISNAVGPQNINYPRYRNMIQTASTAAPNNSLILMAVLMVVLKLLWINPRHSPFNQYHSSKTRFHNIHFDVMSTHNFITCVVSPWRFPTKILHATKSAIIPTIHLDSSGWKKNFILVSFSEYNIFLFKFRVCKSVHHHTFRRINQPDAAVSQVYYLSFKHSSTCFGHEDARNVLSCI